MGAGEGYSGVPSMEGGGEDGEYWDFRARPVSSQPNVSPRPLPPPTKYSELSNAYD